MEEHQQRIRFYSYLPNPLHSGKIWHKVNFFKRSILFMVKIYDGQLVSILADHKLYRGLTIKKGRGDLSRAKKKNRECKFKWWSNSNSVNTFIDKIFKEAWAHSLSRTVKWSHLFLSDTNNSICLHIVKYFELFLIFTNPSARAGYDTRSIFRWSLTGLNSEFSFS